MFLLTSLNRVKNSLGITNTDQDGILLGLIPTASNRIAKSLKRHDAIEKKSRVEYFSPFAGQRTLRTQAYPIQSVTSIYVDSSGLFTGGETLVPSTSYIIAPDGRTIIFAVEAALVANATFPSPGGVYPKSIRVTYIGGLAPSPVSSSWVKSADVAGTLAVGNFIQGQESQFIGLITARAALTISYENLRGIPVPGETIKEYRRANNAAQAGGLGAETGVTATLTSVSAVGGIDQQALAESHPDLVQAAEMQVEYLRANRGNFDKSTVSNDGATRFSRADFKNKYSFMPEIDDILDTYRNKVLA